MRSKRAQLEEALAGTIKDHHRFLLREALTHIDTLDQAIARVGQEIETRMGPSAVTIDEKTQEIETVGKPDEDAENGQEAPDKQTLTWAQAIMLLCTIPGISRRAAEIILAEIGLDITRFPTAKHLASWAGMCPGNHESAGKRLSGRSRKGSPWLRKILVEAAHAAAHTKNTYLASQYRRLATRCGAKKAMVAVGHTLLVIVYHVLSKKEGYQELGGNYFDEQNKHTIEKRLVHRLEKLGYQVELQPTPQIA